MADRSCSIRIPRSRVAWRARDEKRMHTYKQAVETRRMKQRRVMQMGKNKNKRRTAARSRKQEEESRLPRDNKSGKGMGLEARRRVSISKLAAAK